MGGHGGLNILPQKRWNVYGRDNRLKVARDEAAHEAEQSVQREKHRAAEAQARRQLLLDRAKQRRPEALGEKAGSDSDTADAAAAEAGDAGTEAQLLLLQQQEEACRFDARDSKRPRQESQHKQLQVHHAHQQQQQVSTELQEEPVLEHINFWKELETKAQHPERQAEERDKKRKRGNPDTYTSDARFDESFKFGNGLTGPKPWYARAQEPEATLRPGQPAQPNSRQQQQQQVAYPGQQQQLQHSRLEALPGLRADFEQQHHSRKKQRSSRRSNDSTSSDSSTSSSSSNDSSGSSSDSSSERRRRKRSQRHSGSKDKRAKDERERNSRKHSKHKDKSKQHKRRSAAGKAAADQEAAKALALAKLRAERLDREAAERTRALQATGLLPPSTKRFNNSYGYADALRQNQGAAALAAAAAGRGVPAAAAANLQRRFKA